jgi:hypothetical protein
MTLEEATEINSVCFYNSMIRFGLDEGKAKSLKPYTLGQLIEARDIINLENLKAQANPSPRTVTIVCDDRLLAALYAAEHYDPEPMANAKPIVVIANRALLCVDITELRRDAEEAEAMQDLMESL